MCESWQQMQLEAPSDLLDRAGAEPFGLLPREPRARELVERGHLGDGLNGRRRLGRSPQPAFDVREPMPQRLPRLRLRPALHGSAEGLVLAAAEGAEADRERSPALAASFDDVPLRSRDSAALAFGAVTYRWAKLSLGTRNGEQPSDRLSALRGAQILPVTGGPSSRVCAVGLSSAHREIRDASRVAPEPLGSVRAIGRPRAPRRGSLDGRSPSPRAGGGSIRGSWCGNGHRCLRTRAERTLTRMSGSGRERRRCRALDASRPFAGWAQPPPIAPTFP